MVAQEAEAPGALEGVAAELTRPQALEAEAPDAQGGGSRVAADGEEPTNGSGVVSQEATPGAHARGTVAVDITPDAPPLEDHPSGPGWYRLCLESLLKRKRSPCRNDGTRRPLKPRRYVAADEQVPLLLTSLCAVLSHGRGLAGIP